MMHDSGRRSVTRGSGRIAACRGGAVLLAVLAAFAVAGVSGCGSSSSAAGSGAKSSTAGGPLKIGVGEQVIPGVENAAEDDGPALKAAAGYIDAHGGWGGRVVTFDQCTSPGDPASDLKCYNQFIANHDLAVVGGLLSADSLGIATMSKARIPSFTSANGAATASPWQVSTGADGTSVLVAPAHYACAHGDKKVSLLLSDAPIVRTSYNTFPAQTFKNCGISANVVYVPLGAVDPAPYIQKAIGSKPDLLVESIGGFPGPQAIASITAAGFPISKTFFAELNPDPALLANPKVAGALFGSGGDIPDPQDANPDAHAYLQAMNQYAPGSDPNATWAPIVFSQVITIWEASEAIGFGKLTSQALQQYMQSQAPGHLKIFMSRVASSVPAYPGMKQPYIHVVQWTGQQFVNQGWWFSYSACDSQAQCAAAMTMN